MAVTTDIDITNLAFDHLGETTINAFADSNAGLIAERHYEVVIKALLSRYPWRFAVVKKDLGGAEVPTPVNEWKSQWALPTSPALLHILALFNSDQDNAPVLLDYDRYEDKIFANVTGNLYMDYIFLPAVNKWPWYFVELSSAALAAKIAFPITEQKAKADYWKEEAFGTREEKGRGGLFGIAAHADSIETPTKVLVREDSLIIAARNS